jgi:hypothetical protein
MPNPLDQLLFRVIDRWVMTRHPWLPQNHQKVRQERSRPGPFRVAVPTCANEKFAWRMLFDRNPVFSTLNDKLTCKDWVRDQAIDVPMPQVLWVGTDANDIPTELFDRPIVIKANLRSKLNVFHDGTPEHRDAAVATANRFLAEAGEAIGLWDYFNINPRLFVEDRLFDGESFCDLNVLTCGPEVVQLGTTWTGPNASLTRWFRDKQGDFHSGSDFTPNDPDSRPLPATVDRAIAVARQIGARFDNMRVDFLCNDAALYLGEITFNSGNGLNATGFDPDMASNTLWDLRRSWFMTTPQRGWREIYRRALLRELNAAARG